jgi:hypothetical protein
MHAAGMHCMRACLLLVCQLLLSSLHMFLCI